MRTRLPGLVERGHRLGGHGVCSPRAGRESCRELDRVGNPRRPLAADIEHAEAAATVQRDRRHVRVDCGRGVGTPATEAGKPRPGKEGSPQPPPGATRQPSQAPIRSRRPTPDHSALWTTASAASSNSRKARGAGPGLGSQRGAPITASRGDSPPQNTHGGDRPPQPGPGSETGPMATAGTGVAPQARNRRQPNAGAAPRPRPAPSVPQSRSAASSASLERSPLVSFTWAASEWP